MNNRLIKITAGAAAVVAIALGGMAIGRTGSGDSAAANGGFGGGAAGAPPNGAQGRGFGTPVTGTAATKVKEAALAKYPQGTIERIMQRPDGSYEAHVFNGTDEIHVLVSKDFKVTGTEQGGGPPAGGAPPQGAAPPSGTTPPANSQSS